MENENNQNLQNAGVQPNAQYEPNANDPNLQNGQFQQAQGVYYDPTATMETEVPKEKKKGGALIVIIILIVVILLLFCCCGGPVVYVVFSVINSNQSSGGTTPINPYGHPTVDKPVIYLYPEEGVQVTVKVSNPELLTVAYPDYREGWSVLADPDGTLTDPETLRTYYSLYYESNLKNEDLLDRKEGFLVAGDEAAAFLEEKLEVLGLNEREAEEMIIYWLPQLSANDYNLIRFATPEEIEGQMQLTVCPEPDSVIRVWMEFEAVDAEEAKALASELTEQELVTPERSGFTVVEWGGIRIESCISEVVFFNPSC